MNLFFTPGFNNIKDVVDPPTPAKFSIPEWYKNIKTTSGNTIQEKDLNVKHCMPFLDAMSSGYIQKTWADINVYKEKNGDIVFNCDNNFKIFKVRDNVNTPISKDFYSTEFIWQRYWSLKLPDGYSALVTHPMNRIDLPFHTLSGIVDSDQYNHTKFGNIPFYVKNGFTGIIPKNTPMFQIIPIKREEWNSVLNEYNDEEWNFKQKENKKYKFGSYKKQFWQKKKYY